MEQQYEKEELSQEMRNQLLRLWKEELMDTDPELVWLREEYQNRQNKQREEILCKDLECIRHKYPDESAGDVSELGEQFISLMATGLVDPLTAYETIRQRKRKEIPPSMGDVAPFGEEQQGLFTREQVAKMTPLQVKKNFNRIEQSMKHW